VTSSGEKGRPLAEPAPAAPPSTAAGTNGHPSGAAEAPGVKGHAANGAAVIFPHHVAELAKSSIALEFATAANVYSCSDPGRLAKILNWPEDKTLRTMTPGLVYPHLDPTTGKPNGYAQIKFDRPRKLRGQLIKYENPAKKPIQPYLTELAVRAMSDATVEIAITEGAKKALSLAAVGIPAIGLIGVEGWSKARKQGPKGKAAGERELLPELDLFQWNGRRVYIINDSDIAEKKQVQLAEFSLAQALRLKNADVRGVRLPPGPPTDKGDGTNVKQGVDDFLFAKGENGLTELRKLMAEAKTPTAPEDSRPKVYWVEDEHHSIRAALKALATDTTLYQRGAELVSVTIPAAAPEAIDTAGGPRIEVAKEAELRVRLSQVCQVILSTEIGEKQIHVPQNLAKGILSLRKYPGIRPLEAVVQTPPLLADGSVLQQAGHHERSGILYKPKSTYPAIPEKITPDTARASLAEIFYCIADFPFKARHHRSAWLAGLFAMVGRYAFRGCCPLFLVDANIRASGKGLLTDVASIIATGSVMSKYANRTDNNEEMSKLILAIAMAGDRTVCLDNILGVFGCAALDAVLTATVWKGRLLAKNQTGEYPMVTVWWANGNNVVVGGDLSRRCAHVLLHSDCENPEVREDLREKDLLGFVTSHRERLYAAAVTVLAGYIRAGRPRQNLTPWGSFEGFSDLIRQAVVWVGEDDPGLARLTAEPGRDRGADTLQGLLAAWREMDPKNEGLTVSAALQKLTRGTDSYPVAQDVFVEVFGSDERKWSSLAYKLRDLEGRVCQGEFFRSERTTGNVKLWTIGRTGDRQGQTDYASHRPDDSPHLLAGEAVAAVVVSNNGQPKVQGLSPSSPGDGGDQGDKNASYSTGELQSHDNNGCVYTLGAGAETSPQSPSSPQTEPTAGGWDASRADAELAAVRERVATAKRTGKLTGAQENILTAFLTTSTKYHADRDPLLFGAAEDLDRMLAGWGVKQ
jgi:hypothetical protein